MGISSDAVHSDLGRGNWQRRTRWVRPRRVCRERERIVYVRLDCENVCGIGFAGAAREPPYRFNPRGSRRNKRQQGGHTGPPLRCISCTSTNRLLLDRQELEHNAVGVFAEEYLGALDGTARHRGGGGGAHGGSLRIEFFIQGFRVVHDEADLQATRVVGSRCPPLRPPRPCIP